MLRVTERDVLYDFGNDDFDTDVKVGIRIAEAPKVETPVVAPVSVHQSSFAQADTQCTQYSLGNACT